MNIFYISIKVIIRISMEEDKKTASEMNQDAISIEIMESNKS